MMRDFECTKLVAEIVARVLGISLSEAQLARRGISEEWDSLNNIEILFQIEEAFGLHFSEDDFAEMSDVNTIASAVLRVRGG